MEIAIRIYGLMVAGWSYDLAAEKALFEHNKEHSDNLTLEEVAYNWKKYQP